ncbi:nucleotide pyrophosphohydrolase [Iodobacter fluviatilis]|jgi:NTP pyrophosphatase (non-canonical NTP hydrolase)|uniref:Nucleotide pyrophosphohydrolase n=1 Tax=Iodobacter fluviatilis TaxID=537 RepID=A0A7G3G762_9NEIS|nr:nucleotide pyrophosphohydrolase [Iodobacter fluviatilis]QBC42958.1 nucleotide pyrophosphohydrolase [Iodobacter fluviatilis]
MDLNQLMLDVRQFAKDRDWERYHTPKNLCMAMSVEMAELLEHFQWDTAEESQQLSSEKRTAVEQEMADVLLYMIRLSDVLNVDLETAIREKILLNAIKYPPLSK